MNYEYPGSQIRTVSGVKSVEECQKICDEHLACILFTYVGHSCHLKGEFVNRKFSKVSSKPVSFLPFAEQTEEERKERERTLSLKVFLICKEYS